MVKNIVKHIKNGIIPEALPNTFRRFSSTQLYLRSVADEENINVRELWLPPLKDYRTLSEVVSEYGYEKKDGILEIPVGEYDDPYNQMQGILTVPFTESGNALVYGSAGSGKTTFLTTLLYSMLSVYSPNEVRTYILDFASETLRAFENAPQVGEVMFSDAMAKRYADRCLANYTYSEISVKRVDICDAPGDEFIFVGTRYRPEITGYAIGNGKLIGIYPTSNACYLTERNGKNYLLCYNQIHNSESTNGYKRTYTDYEFWFQRYDTDYYSYKEGYKKITVYDDVEPNDTYKEFFDEFNRYLEKATVCCDSYELKGYKIMPSTEADYSVSEKGKYLSISNCDVNKSGTVNDEVFSWLNFRTGPGITYDRILTDRNDPESFVKQVRGSNVTVIDTVNTGDAENPIWVKIQIKYSTYSLTGYSSQKYIDINSIKHISVGESFKIKANTNDSNLKWTVNDSNVLSVNSSTGEITGKSRGLVLVKVTSDSGLTDSCLIMVD